MKPWSPNPLINWSQLRSDQFWGLFSDTATCVQMCPSICFFVAHVYELPCGTAMLAALNPELARCKISAGQGWAPCTNSQWKWRDEGDGFRDDRGRIKLIEKMVDWHLSLAVSDCRSLRNQMRTTKSLFTPLVVCSWLCLSFGYWLQLLGYAPVATVLRRRFLLLTPEGGIHHLPGYPPYRCGSHVSCSVIIPTLVTSKSYWASMFHAVPKDWW